MDNKLNVQKLGYEVGEPMWVHWDDRYVLRGGHILGKCPDENLITTVGYLAYMDDKSIILGRGIENHWYVYCIFYSTSTVLITMILNTSSQ